MGIEDDGLDGEVEFVGFAPSELSAPEAEKSDKVETDEQKAELELSEEDKVEEGETEQDAEDRRKRSKPAHQRISELTAQRREAERERDALRAEIEALMGGKQTDKQDDKAPELPQRPDPADFEFGEADPAYIDKLTDWKVETRLAERDQKSKQQQEQQQLHQEIATLDTKWQDAATKAVEKYPDFNEVVLESAAAGDWPCPPLVAAAISNSDQGADIAYHLAKNPEEAEALARLAQTDAAELFRRFGRLEARFESREEERRAVERKVTKAPEPPVHRARGAGGQFETPDDTDDLDAFSNKFYAKK